MYVLHTEDVLEILLGKYFYQIVFETDSAIDQPTESVSIAPAVTEVKGSDGVWESVDDGKLLIFTPKNVNASNKVFAILTINLFYTFVVIRCIFKPSLLFYILP